MRRLAVVAGSVAAAAGLGVAVLAAGWAPALVSVRYVPGGSQARCAASQAGLMGQLDGDGPVVLVRCDGDGPVHVWDVVSERSSR